MKRIFCVVLCLAIALQLQGKGVKYVFYFIGDGMGVNTVAYTQYYKAAENGSKGAEPLLFSNFPVVSIASTWSNSSRVTDSAASGTALATGVKTNNRVIGLDPDGNPLESIAAKCARNGRKVAILTTVGINHATPASFYAHQPTRDNYDQIVYDMASAGFDFYAGSKVLRSKKNIIEDLDYEKVMTDAGYTIVGGHEQFKSEYRNASKMLYVCDKKHRVSRAIDRDVASRIPVTLEDYMNSAIEFLMKDGCRQGFFLMAEGGDIDGCNHGRDAAASVKEVLDFEKAVAVAYEFYRKHPDETAILITADHDTGSPYLAIDKGADPSRLDYQTASCGRITETLKTMMKKEALSWDQVKDFLSENFGLWTKVEVKKEDEAHLRDVYDKTIAKAETGNVTDDFGYNNDAVIVFEAMQILDKYAGVVWPTRTHSAGYVPVYYIGPHPELFDGALDNACFVEKLETLMRAK